MFTRGRLSRAAFLCLTLAGLALAPLPFNGQTRRAPRRDSSAKETGQSAPRAAKAEAKLIRSPKAEALARAFEEGRLPEPSRLPSGSADEQAATLAEAVSKGDSSSTAALYAAVLASGFGVRGSDGAILQTTGSGQGIAFDAWEIAALSKLYGEGYGAELTHLAESFTRNVPQLANVPLANVLAEGVRAGAQSDNQSLRFWARFIVELGRRSNPGYNLLAQTDAGKVRLDAIQLAFILKRLAGDLALTERKDGAERARVENIVGSGTALIVRAVFSDEAEPARQGAAQSPCSLSDLDGLILDYNALAVTTGFGLLIGHLGKDAPMLDKYGKAVSIANVVLAVLKFLASYSLLDIEIKMDDATLVRTKSHTESGERRTLSAELKIEAGKWQALNCIRPALNSMGLDVSLPGEGPVAGVNVQWKLILGGDSLGNFLQGVRESVNLILYGKETPTDAIVGLRAVEGDSVSTANLYTDENGVSRVYVVGRKQTRDVSKEKLFEVNKVAGVKADVQLKTMKIKDAKDAASAGGDLAGNVISFLTGDVAAGVVGAITETLYRSNWHSSEPFYFLVKDWEPCAGLWHGAIHTSVRYENKSLEYGETQEVVLKRESSRTSEAKVVIEGGRATANLRAEESVSSDNNSGYGRVTHEQLKHAQLSGAVEAAVSVSAQGRYDVSFMPLRVVGTHRTSGTCKRPAPYKCQPPKTVSKPWEVSSNAWVYSFSGDMDPNRPNEINDARTWKDGDTEKSVTVKLKRCN